MEARADSGPSFGPWVGTLPSNHPCHRGAGQETVPWPPDPCKPHCGLATSASSCLGPDWHAGRGREPSWTTSSQETHRLFARGPSDLSYLKPIIKGTLGSEGPPTGYRRSQPWRGDPGSPRPARGLPRNRGTRILSAHSCWGRAEVCMGTLPAAS